MKTRRGVQYNAINKRIMYKELIIRLDNADAVTYVSDFRRNPLPDKIVWDLSTRADSRETNSFYWLQADKSVNKGIIIAEIDRKTNTITITPDENVNGDFAILISPYMLDVSKPINILTPDFELSGTVEPSEELMRESLSDRGDPNYIFVDKFYYSDLSADDDEEDEEVRDSNGNTQLILSAVHGNTKAVNDLLDSGADVDAKNKWGMTALMYAAEGNHTETVNALLEADADIDDTNNEGSTALIIAAIHGCEETINILLDSEADVDIENQDGKTALDYARENNKFKGTRTLKRLKELSR